MNYEFWLQNVYEAEFRIYKDGVHVKSIRFNSTGSDTHSWYRRENIISSDWNDLDANGPKYMKLHTSASSFHNRINMIRHFEILKHAESCESLSLWFLTVTRTENCTWGKHYDTYPRFIYSRGEGAANPNVKEAIQLADSIAVYVRV